MELGSLNRMFLKERKLNVSFFSKRRYGLLKLTVATYLNHDHNLNCQLTQSQICRKDLELQYAVSRCTITLSVCVNALFCCLVGEKYYLFFHLGDHSLFDWLFCSCWVNKSKQRKRSLQSSTENVLLVLLELTVLVYVLTIDILYSHRAQHDSFSTGHFWNGSRWKQSDVQTNKNCIPVLIFTFAQLLV